MSQIENHPEGFNFLRRMYTDIQEPVMQVNILGGVPIIHPSR